MKIIAVKKERQYVKKVKQHTEKFLVDAQITNKRAISIVTTVEVTFSGKMDSARNLKRH